MYSLRKFYQSTSNIRTFQVSWGKLYLILKGNWICTTLRNLKMRVIKNLNINGLGGKEDNC